MPIPCVTEGDGSMGLYSKTRVVSLGVEGNRRSYMYCVMCCSALLTNDKSLKIFTVWV